MMKYKIVFTDDVPVAERTVECDFMTAPSLSDPMYSFWTTQGHHAIIFLSVNCNQIKTIEKLPDDEPAEKTNVFDEKVEGGELGAVDPMGPRAFGHE